MYVATPLLSKRVSVKAEELQTTHDLLLCALQVIHSHKWSCDLRENPLLVDGYIAYEFTRLLVQQLLQQAKSHLMSKEPVRVQESCRAVALMDQRALYSFPHYKAYKTILHNLVGKGPILQLHLDAVELVAGLSYDLRSRYKGSTLTEVVLKECKEEVASFAIAEVLE